MDYMVDPPMEELLFRFIRFLIFYLNSTLKLKYGIGDLKIEL